MKYEEMKAFNLKKGMKLIIDYRSDKHEAEVLKIKEFKGRQSGKYFNGRFWTEYPEQMTIELELSFIKEGHTDKLQNQHIEQIEVME